MRVPTRTFWLLLLTLAELGLAIYVVGAISPALADLSPVTITVPTTTTTAPSSATSPTATSTATPAAPTPTTTATMAQPIRSVEPFGLVWNHPSAELLDLLLVITLAAIGASIHGLTSLTTFIGNRRFVASWTAWYVIRMPVGVAIAVLLYFVVRAGFVTVGAAATSINPYGIAALGGLAGMFSKQATDKLRVIFDTVFNTSADQQRQDKLDGGMTIDHATPASVPVGTADRTIRVFGEGFYAATTANVNGDNRPVVAQHSTQVSVTLTAGDVASPGVVTVNLVAPGPSPAPSDSIEVRIRPQINEIRANDDHDLTPHVIGVGFTQHSKVYVGDRKATIVARAADNTELTVQITQAEFDDRESLELRIRNQAKEGGDSDPLPLTAVVNWPPA